MNNRQKSLAIFFIVTLFAQTNHSYACGDPGTEFDDPNPSPQLIMEQKTKEFVTGCFVAVTVLVSAILIAISDFK